ncbi:MAG TPA: methyl viologen-reducing hydrogenase [Candidatus Desulfofervidus auxilii]|uniref:Methyl viologen-reducing hydrogenase n=1 Tax=Desulfofervidus auxilii TaxID=1621989 RepID=A0A7C0Y8P9_DESA2|nr:methyl viologen-reducing hydrogenase [Candidatus Desulfofervidus auxilii]
MGLKVVEEFLNACSGCELSILNMGETWVDVLKELEFVHMPLLIDNKYFGQTGEGTQIEIPEADIAIVSGSVRNEEQKQVLEEIRKKCKILIALGTCATNGGIPALANMWSKEEILNSIYTNPPKDVPAWLDRVYALDEIVKVDVYVPGCPPHAKNIADAITALIKGETWSLPERSVCDSCPLKREKKASSGTVKRSLENLEFDPEKPLDEMRCIMEQGFLCLGPVTKAGCRGDSDAPRCIRARIGCRGCFGPIRKGAKPMVEMMTAWSSIGLNAQAVPDRRALLNRFIGAHNNLRPLPKR